MEIFNIVDPVGLPALRVCRDRRRQLSVIVNWDRSTHFKRLVSMLHISHLRFALFIITGCTWGLTMQSTNECSPVLANVYIAATRKKNETPSPTSLWD